MKKRFFSIVVLVSALTLLFIYCAGNRSGSGKGDAIEAIGMVILLPDSTAVSGATVRTEPMSSYVETYSDGSFRMAEGLTEGRYAFIAQYNGIEGTTNTDLQANSNNFVIIMLGKVYDMKDWTAGKKAAGSSGPGGTVQTYP